MTLEQIVQQIEILSLKRDLFQNHQNNLTNKTFSSADLKTETLLSRDFSNENRAEINDVRKPEKIQQIIEDESPVPGARLGRDEDGNPAWYIEDPSNNGEYIKINV